MSSAASLGLCLFAGACGLEEIELGPQREATAPDADLDNGATEESPLVVVTGPGEIVVDVVSLDPEKSLGAAPPLESAPDDPAFVPTPGCGKIDFLFIVDNSLSMRSIQAKVADSFPQLMRGVEAAAPADDFQIMVIDTDGDEDPPRDAQDCEDTLGAGRRLDDEELDCGISGEQRYIVDGQGDLSEVFSCIADVGASGDAGEEPMDALFAALSPAQNTGAGCNAGFRREDALLVVTIVTDEDDRRSEGDADVWYQALVDLNRGRAESAVVLGLLGDNNLPDGLAGGPCGSSDADGAPELQRFVQGFPYGLLHSVCAESFTPLFEQAAGVIAEACTNFPPNAP